MTAFFLVRILLELVCYSLTMLGVWATGRAQLSRGLRYFLVCLGAVAAVFGAFASLALAPHPPFPTYSAFLLIVCHLLTYFAYVCAHTRRQSKVSGVASWSLGATAGSLLRVLAEWVIVVGWITTPTALTCFALGLATFLGAGIYSSLRALLPLPKGAYIAHQQHLSRRHLFFYFLVAFSITFISLILIGVGLESGALQNNRLTRVLLQLLHLTSWIGMGLTGLRLAPIVTEPLALVARQPQAYGPEK